MKTKGKIRKILISCMVFILIIMWGYVGNYQYNLIKNEKEIEEIREQKKEVENPEEKHKNESITQSQETKESSTDSEILEKYKILYQENSDLIGWIKIDDTKVDYPVMQTDLDNPIYYINKNWDKEKSFAGLPLLDARCTSNSENWIIHSHNMNNGTMFGSLKKYKDYKYYQNHQIIKFDTLYEEASYQIIGVFLSKYYEEGTAPEESFLYYDDIELDSEEEFNDYIDNVKKLSLYDTEETAEYGNQLLTLSTCDKYTEDGRLVIVAKKIQ